MKTIDDATPEEWNSLRKGFRWPYEAVEDDAVNEHPVFAEKAMKKTYDTVNNPVHYNTGNIECIDAMEAMLSKEEFIGYLRGNSFKYRWRMRHKGRAVQDLQKSQWYENKLLSIIESDKQV